MQNMNFIKGFQIYILTKMSGILKWLYTDKLYNVLISQFSILIKNIQQL